MFFSAKERFKKRCRKRMEELGWIIGKSDDLTVDIVGGLRGHLHVCLVRTADKPITINAIRDMQEMKRRYAKQRFVCITEKRETKDWVREAAQRRLFIASIDDLTTMAELPPSDDEALTQYAEAAG